MPKGNWWKYGLCVFGGLGVGYLVGVKVTKDRAEKETDEKIEAIRDIYRNNRKADAKKKPDTSKIEAPEIQTKTSIDVQLLSEKKEQAEKAAQRYSGNYDEPRVTVDKNAEPPDEEKPSNNWKDYIHLIDEIPQEVPEEKIQTLVYYMDGVLCYAGGGRVEDSQINQMVGEDNLKLLEADACNQIYLQNDQYGLWYAVLYSYDEWAKISDEEPYRKTL